MDRPVMVITGTRTGLGRGMAEHFVKNGYSVAGCSRGAPTLEMEGYQHAQVDVCDENQVRKWIRSLQNAYRRIDVVVCNAGFAPAALLMTMTPGEVLAWLHWGPEPSTICGPGPISRCRNSIHPRRQHQFLLGRQR